MSDLISREAALQSIDREMHNLNALQMYGAEHIVVHYARRIIEELPAEDVEPVKRGRWVDDCCSECGQYVYHGDMRNYCPCCGAKMEVETDDPN